MKGGSISVPFVQHATTLPNSAVKYVCILLGSTFPELLVNDGVRFHSFEVHKAFTSLDLPSSVMCLL